MLKISRLDERDKEALEAAIQALSQEPCEKCEVENTNGDVIINIFDVKEIHTMTTTVFAVLQDGTELEFKRSWWDESYKKGGKG